MLSNTCKYAIRSVIYLAVHGNANKKIGIKTISQELNIPSPFLGKILQQLSKNKLLNSTKGPNGGFCLGRNPDEINLLEIIRVVDGLDFFDTCIIGMKICSGDDKNKKKCPFHDKLDPIREELYCQFQSLSIGSFKNGLADINNVLSL
jgi:Rrf2 family protein